MLLSERFDRALLLAHRVHRLQHRKGRPVPYIAHLLAVAAVTLDYGGSEDQAIAALLHDALEDTQGMTPRELRAVIHGEFGDLVLQIVEDCTDTDAQPKPPWRARKEQYIAHLRAHAHEQSLIVSAADKLHNVQSLVRDHRHEGDATFARFNKEAGKSGTVWYYRSLAEVFLERMPGRLADDLDRAVRELEAAAGRSY